MACRVRSLMLACERYQCLVLRRSSRILVLVFQGAEVTKLGVGAHIRVVDEHIAARADPVLKILVIQRCHARVAVDGAKEGRQDGVVLGSVVTNQRLAALIGNKLEAVTRGY